MAYNPNASWWGGDPDAYRPRTGLAGALAHAQLIGNQGGVSAPSSVAPPHPLPPILRFGGVDRGPVIGNSHGTGAVAGPMSFTQYAPPTFTPPGFEGGGNPPGGPPGGGFVAPPIPVKSWSPITDYIPPPQPAGQPPSTAQISSPVAKSFIASQQPTYIPPPTQSSPTTALITTALAQLGRKSNPSTALGTGFGRLAV